MVFFFFLSSTVLSEIMNFPIKIIFACTCVLNEYIGPFWGKNLNIAFKVLGNRSLLFMTLQIRYWGNFSLPTYCHSRFKEIAHLKHQLSFMTLLLTATVTLLINVIDTVTLHSLSLTTKIDWSHKTISKSLWHMSNNIHQYSITLNMKLATSIEMLYIPNEFSYTWISPLWRYTG